MDGVPALGHQESFITGSLLATQLRLQYPRGAGDGEDPHPPGLEPQLPPKGWARESAPHFTA